MSINKNILFITHHNNDLDHFLPLAAHLKKEKQIDVKILAFYNKYELLQNRLHKYICYSNNIVLDSITDFFYFNRINGQIIKAYKYAINNAKDVKSSKQTEGRLEEIEWKIAVFLKSPVDTIISFLQVLLKKYIAFYSLFLLNENKILNYIHSNNIKLAIIDHREFDESLISSNPMINFINVITGKTDPLNHLMFRVAKIVRERKIPILMIPHGPQPISKKILDARTRLRQRQILKPFRPDFLVVGNKNELLLLPNIHGLKSTLFLGDPRFDIDWINYLESCALDVYSSQVTKPKDKTVLLYLMDNFTYLPEGNQEYKLEMHKDILSLVNHFSNLEIWIKHHPRNVLRHVFEVSINDFILKERGKNIIQFGNNTDTNILSAKADICISASSTTFISPIFQKKPVILYDKWKEVHHATSIFDELESKASTREELIVQYKKIINGEYTIDDYVLLSFCKKVFSLDSLSESMVEKYAKNIIEIMNDEKIS